MKTSNITSHRVLIPRQAAAVLVFLLTIGGMPAGLNAQDPGSGHKSRDNVSIDGLVADDFSGNHFSTDQLDGKIVLLDFWATWCSPCLEAFPSLKQLENDLGGDDFQVVSVALYSGDGKDLQWVVDKYSLTHTLLAGGPKVPLAFDLLGFPTYLLMGRDGKLIRRYVGDFNDPVSRIRDDVVALLKGNNSMETSSP